MTTIPEPNVNPAAMPWARAMTKAVRDAVGSGAQLRSALSATQHSVGVVAAQTATQQRELAGVVTELAPNVPPLTPTPPLLETALGTVTVTWDGKFTEAEGYAPGFSHVNVQVSPTGTNGWVVTGQPLTGEGQSSILTSQVGEVRHFRFVAVNNAGTQGTPSAPRSITVTGIAAPDIDGTIMDAINQAAADSAEAVELASVAQALASTAEVEAQAAQAAAGNALSVANTAQGTATAANTAAANAAGIAGSKADVIYSNTAPAADKRLATTLWIDTTNNANTPKRWNAATTSWVTVTDKAATDAAAAAAAAQATAGAAAADASAAAIAAGNALTTANGKNKIWHQASQPPLTGNTTGDIWWDSDDGNRMYEWNGAWTANQFGTNALSDSAINAAKLADKAVASAKLADKAVGTAQLADAVNTSITTAQSTATNAATVAGNAATAASTAQTAANNAQSDAAAAASAAASAAGIAGAKGEVIFSATAPAAAKQLTQNLWIDTTGNANTPKRWNGNAWAAVTDKAATDAAAAAVTAKSAADAAQGTANTATTLANSAKTAADAAASAASAAQGAATAAQTTANGKNKIVRSSAAASGTNYSNGDQWWQFSGSQVTNMWIYEGGWVKQTITDSLITNLNAGTITAGTISTDRFGANTITGVHIAGATVTAANMVAGTITAASGIIADAAISRAKIQDLAVDTAQIADLAVETGKINSLAVTEAKIGALAVTEAKIANLAVTNGKIANLAVNNAKIADATIEHGKIATLDANKITVGTLNAGRLAAGSISTGKLLVTSFENLTEDPSFEYGSVWSTSHANTTIDGTNVRTGTKAMRVVSGAVFEASRSSQSFSVNEGDRYRIGGWVRLDSGTSASNGLTLRFGFGATEGAQTSTSPDIALTPNGTGTTYTRISGVWTVPAGARFASPQVIMRDAAAGKVYRLDDVEIFKMTDASLIVDGTITATQLATDSVTATQIAANAVVSNSIAGGAIDGKTITGATIRTAASGQRVQLDTSGLRAFNSSNVVTGALTASAGGLTLSGVLTTGATNAQRVEVDATSVEFFDTAGVRGGGIAAHNPTPGNAGTAGVQLASNTGALTVGRVNLPYGGSAEAWMSGGFKADELHTGKLYVEGRDIGFDSGWITPPLQSGWTHSITVQYRRIGNILYLRGRPTGGVSGVVFTLPAGFRVPVAQAYAAVTGGASPALFTRIILQTNGAVETLTGNGDPNLHSIGGVPLD